MNERIAKIIDFTKGPAILDVGCVGSSLNEESPYWLHQRLRERFSCVVGVDINADAVRYLQSRGYQVLLMNAEDLALDQKYDTITAGELIEHLSNPGKFLETVKRHLKPQGRVIVTTPYPFAAMNVLYALVKYPKTCSNKEHTLWFCPSTFQELVRRYGYKVFHFELVEDYYEEVDSLLYRLFKTFVKPLLPKRLRNNAMLFVLECEEQ